MTMHQATLGQSFELPCGAVLKNRMIKSAMSDSLGDGRGSPTHEQIRLYERWAHGGAAALIIGEVQGNPHYAEKPGNLVLQNNIDPTLFRELAKRGSSNDTHLWMQLGHAGAMAHPPISTPKGPSEIDVPGLTCAAMPLEEIKSLPTEFARSARMAQDLGFSGVQIHAAHGFLLNQFLSPLFNKREDEYGGSIDARMRLLLEVVAEVRAAVDSNFAVAVKLNATDQLEGGFQEEEALNVIKALDKTDIDLIEISGGTYFPGAKSASDAQTSGPYFLPFSQQARLLTSKPLMVTGGFKNRDQACEALESSGPDLIGLARAFVLDPDLPNNWLNNKTDTINFPRFSSPPEGGITAWYTMRLTQLGQDDESDEAIELESVIKTYDDRDEARAIEWRKWFEL